MSKITDTECLSPSPSPSLYHAHSLSLICSALSVYTCLSISVSNDGRQGTENLWTLLPIVSRFIFSCNGRRLRNISLESDDFRVSNAAVSSTAFTEKRQALISPMSTVAAADGSDSGSSGSLLLSSKSWPQVLHIHLCGSHGALHPPLRRRSLSQCLI